MIDANGKSVSGGCPVLVGYDPLDPKELVDPFPSYSRACKEVPVFYDEKLGFWSLTRRADILALVQDTERFSNRLALPMPLPPEHMRDRMPKYPFATALVFLDGEEHRIARQMVQAPFTPRRLREMTPMMREAAVRLLRLDDPDRQLEFVREYATPFALVVIGDILGVPEADFPLLERSIEGGFRLTSGFWADDEIEQLAAGQLEYWDYLCALVEERRADPRGDFCSVLAEYVNEDGTRPSTDEIAAHVNTILGAGFETSAQLMSFGVKAILSHRDQWELLKSDRTLVPRAVEECIRYRSVFKRGYRVATTDVEIAGVLIPAGSVVAWIAASANRDEAAYPDPERFDISRRTDNLTFGKGQHFCLGAPLSKLELQITLETMLDCAPDARVVEGQEIRYRDDMRIDAMLGLQLELGTAPPRSDEPGSATT